MITLEIITLKARHYVTATIVTPRMNDWPLRVCEVNTTSSRTENFTIDSPRQLCTGWPHRGCRDFDTPLIRTSISQRDFAYSITTWYSVTIQSAFLRSSGWCIVRVFSPCNFLLAPSAALPVTKYVRKYIAWSRIKWTNTARKARWHTLGHDGICNIISRGREIYVYVLGKSKREYYSEWDKSPKDRISSHRPFCAIPSQLRHVSWRLRISLFRSYIMCYTQFLR